MIVFHNATLTTQHCGWHFALVANRVLLFHIASSVGIAACMNLRSMSPSCSMWCCTPADLSLFARPLHQQTEMPKKWTAHCVTEECRIESQKRRIVFAENHGQPTVAADDGDDCIHLVANVRSFLSCHCEFMLHYRRCEIGMTVLT